METVEVRTTGKDEVRKALKKTRNGKAVGPDDMLVKLRSPGERVEVFRTILFHVILDSEKIPEDQRKRVLVSIVNKKGGCEEL